MKENANIDNLVKIKEFSTEAKLEKVRTVQAFISRNLENISCSDEFKMQVALAAEEIFVNIALYAYDQSLQSTETNLKSNTVSVRISVGTEVVIEFEDSGKPFNPLDRSDPDITLNAQEREVGGLGIFMVKNIMDSVEYRFENNKNILLIKKSIV